MNFRGGLTFFYRRDSSKIRRLVVTGFWSNPCLRIGRHRVKAHVAESRDGFTLKVYCGDRSSLLAFDLDAGHPDRPRLAGFAVTVTGPDGRPRTLANRLSFLSSYTSRTTAADREWTPSDQAPFQKFRWSDFPPATLPGTYRYAATAMLFGAGATDSDPRLE